MRHSGSTDTVAKILLVHYRKGPAACLGLHAPPYQATLLQSAIVDTASPASHWSRLPFEGTLLLHQLAEGIKPLLPHVPSSMHGPEAGPHLVYVHAKGGQGCQKSALMVALAGLRGCLRTICVGVVAPSSVLLLLASLWRSRVSADTARPEKSSPAKPYSRCKPSSAI